MRYIDAIHLRLEELCEKKGVTLRQLCRMSGVSPSLAKRLENKEIRDMSFFTLTKLCWNLHITTSDFFKGEIFVPLDEENKRQHALFLEQKEKDKKKKKWFLHLRADEVVLHSLISPGAKFLARLSISNLSLISPVNHWHAKDLSVYYIQEKHPAFI